MLAAARFHDTERRRKNSRRGHGAHQGSPFQGFREVIVLVRIVWRVRLFRCQWDTPITQCRARLG